MAYHETTASGIVNDTELQTLCERMQIFANAILKAHRLGIDEGTFDAPWSLEYQREAADIYFSATPAGYLANLAKVFIACAEHLASNSPPANLSDDWFIITTYLQSASTAISEHLETLGLANDRQPPHPFDETAPPEIIRFDLIAGLCSNQGAQTLADAATALSQHFENDQLFLNEQETKLLREIASGTKIVDLATDFGYSERSMYRVLKDIYKKLDVKGRPEAIRTAASNGWLDD